jgi:tetratricopeptide (TPR) repeat protein
MTEFIIGFTVVLVILWALINRQRQKESRDAVARLGTLMNAFSYNSEILLVDNINNAERAMKILRKAQERKPDAVYYDEAQHMYELGFEYKPELPVAANLAVLSAVIRALKG